MFLVVVIGGGRVVGGLDGSFSLSASNLPLSVILVDSKQNDNSYHANQEPLKGDCNLIFHQVFEKDKDYNKYHQAVNVDCLNDQPSN